MFFIIKSYVQSITNYSLAKRERAYRARLRTMTEKDLGNGQIAKMLYI